MFRNATPILLDKHQNTKIKAIANFDFAKDINMGPVMLHEFSKVAPIYPIVFIEGSKEGSFKPVSLFGLEPSENLFIKEDIWQATYIPATIRRYPFVLASSPDSKHFTVCVDENCTDLNEEEGQALFTEEGQPTEILEKAKLYLQELQKMETFTDEFVNYLIQQKLLVPLNIKVPINNSLKTINGAYAINEELLNLLPDETFVEMRQKGYISAIYAHLVSIAQVDRLVGLRNEKTA